MLIFATCPYPFEPKGSGLALSRRRPVNLRAATPHHRVLLMLLLALHVHGAASFQHLLALFGRGVMPLLAQRSALLGGELLEAAVVLAYRLLLSGAQGLEALPPLA